MVLTSVESEWQLAFGAPMPGMTTVDLFVRFLCFITALGFLVYCVKSLAKGFCEGIESDPLPGNQTRKQDFCVLLAGTTGIFCLTVLFLWAFITTLVWRLH